MVSALAERTLLVPEGAEDDGPAADGAAGADADRLAFFFLGPAESPEEGRLGCVEESAA